MNEAFGRRVLSVIMEFIHREGYADYDGFASKLTHTYIQLLEEKGNPTSEDFSKSAEKIRTNFFRTNRGAKKREFISRLFNKLSTEVREALSSFDLAKRFVSTYFEVGFDSSKFQEERRNIIEKIMTVSKPHKKLIVAFSRLLQKIKTTYQIELHSTKEFSGADIVKKLGNIKIGFQVKSKNDDISEEKIRSTVSHAQEWKLNSLVLVYGREEDKRVKESIAAAYHFFERVNSEGKIYCSVIQPNLLAELFRCYKISLE
ncbi:MAG: hypothetical protein H3Z53_01210 [archaeon]|nr:hypothetical protein [archaeon]MCP8312981.1 hypothetical protein [archaeon]